MRTLTGRRVQQLRRRDQRKARRRRGPPLPRSSGLRQPPVALPRHRHRHRQRAVRADPERADLARGAERRPRRQQDGPHVPRRAGHRSHRAGWLYLRHGVHAALLHRFRHRRQADWSRPDLVHRCGVIKLELNPRELRAEDTRRIPPPLLRFYLHCTLVILF